MSKKHKCYENNERDYMIRSLSTIMVLTISLVVSTITLVIPFSSVSAFSSHASDEHCSSRGAAGTDLNPNCFGGRIPSCSSNGQDEGKAGCRDQGTCVNNQPNDKRKTGPTPVCPFD